MKELIFVGDPMCSWCWGFEPVLKRLRTQYKIDFIAGGLRTQGESVWNEPFKNELKQHWHEVEKATGQGFNNAFFERKEFVYDTYIPCQAVVAMRHISPENTLDYFTALQKAFYTENRDITDQEVLFELAEPFLESKESFIKAFKSETIAKKTRDDFLKARTLGANAFPSLVVIDASGHLNTLRGYRHYETIVRMID